MTPTQGLVRHPHRNLYDTHTETRVTPTQRAVGNFLGCTWEALFSLCLVCDQLVLCCFFFFQIAVFQDLLVKLLMSAGQDGDEGVLDFSKFVCVCMCVCVCVCVCQRKTKDRADGMSEKSAHCPRRDSNLYLWDTRPPCCRLHHEGRARLASVETNTLDTHPSAPPRNNHA